MENIKTFSFFFDEDAEGFIFEWKNPFDIPSRLPHCNLVFADYEEIEWIG